MIKLDLEILNLKILPIELVNKIMLYTSSIPIDLKKEIQNFKFTGLTSYAFWSTELLNNGKFHDVYIPVCDPDLWNRNSTFLRSYKKL